MNRFLSLLLTIAILSSCNKGDTKRGEPATGIDGTWKLVETYSSNGSNGKWSTVPLPHQYTVSFNTNNVLSYSSNFEYADSGYNRFTFSSNHLVYAATSNSRLDSFVVSEITHSEFKMSSLQRICYEGCAQKFKRVN